MSVRILHPRRPWEGRRVVLGVTGGIAAYKSVQVARDLTRLGARVDVIMTPGAQRFIQPLSFQGVTGQGRVHRHVLRVRDRRPTSVWEPRPTWWWWPLPPPTSWPGRPRGSADDLLATTLLVTRAPVILCPAMNERMFSHPQTQANLRHLTEELDYRVAGPGAGPLAYGEGTGPGRMLEPDEIVQHVGRALGREPAWEGRKVVVTAGPTREPLDPVRFLGNRSSGSAWALPWPGAAWRRGAEVTLVTGPSALAGSPGSRRPAGWKPARR